MKIFTTIAENYAANSTVMWSSMIHYLELAIIPLAMLIILEFVKSFSRLTKHKNHESDFNTSFTSSMLHDISWGLLLIAWVKFIIAFSSCFINFIYRMF